MWIYYIHDKWLWHDLTALHRLVMKRSMLYCFLTNWNDTYNSSQLLIIDTYRNRIINQWYPESMMCQVYTVLSHNDAKYYLLVYIAFIPTMAFFFNSWLIVWIYEFLTTCLHEKRISKLYINFSKSISILLLIFKTQSQKICLFVKIQNFFFVFWCNLVNTMININAFFKDFLSKVSFFFIKSNQNYWKNLLFCWIVVVEVMKCAFSLSARVFPSVISWPVNSLLKTEGVAKSSSETAKSWIGNSGMLSEKAVRVDSEARLLAE